MLTRYNKEVFVVGLIADLKVSDPKILNDKVMHSIPNMMCKMRLAMEVK